MITVDGFEDLEQAMNRFYDEFHDELLGAVWSTAEYVKTDAVKLAPIDTGKLRQSANVQRDKDDTYIFFTMDYSIPVHERMESYHKVGQAKFLEHAFNKWKPKVGKTIFNEIAWVLR